jgi:hypothetical protein
LLLLYDDGVRKWEKWSWEFLIELCWLHVVMRCCLMSEWNNDSWVREGGRHVREGGVEGRILNFLRWINSHVSLSVLVCKLSLTRTINFAHSTPNSQDLIN